jgi:hypothetical protein
MSPRQSPLEVVWTVPKGGAQAEPRLRVRVPKAPGSASGEITCLEFELAVCPDPRCSCSNVELITPAGKGSKGSESKGTASGIWLDLINRDIAQLDTPSAAPLVEQLESMLQIELGFPDQRDLEEWFAAKKLDRIYRATAKEVNTSELPEAEPDMMMSFVEVFPRGLAFLFIFRGERWAVEDRFCIKDKCGCTESVLTFVPLSARAQKTHGDPQPPLEVRYDFGTHEPKLLSDCEPMGSLEVELLAAAKAANPEFDDLLHLRSTILRSAYMRREIELQFAKVAQISSSLAAARVKPAVMSVGRNDPCPCGSGKKFKRCCFGIEPVRPD